MHMQQGRTGFHMPRHLMWVALLVPGLLLLSGLFVYPVANILGLSLYDAQGHWTSEHYRKLFASPVYFQSLVITFQLSAWTTLITLLSGFPVAYVLASSDASVSRKLLVLVLLPFWTSFLVRTFAWMVILGRGGTINSTLLSLGLIDRPLDLMYNQTGALIGMVQVMLPLFVLAVTPVLQKIDRNLLKAAATMGAGTSQSFWRVYFPLAMPGVAGGGILVFVTSLGFFITPSLLGGRNEMVVSRIIIREIQEGVNWGFPSALAVVLLLATIVFFVLYDRIVGLSALSGTETSRGATPVLLRRIFAVFAAAGDLAERAIEAAVPARANRPRPRLGAWVLWLAVGLVILYLILPVLLVLPVSFTRLGYIGWPPQLFSWQWYERVFQSPLWSNALIRSLLIGFGTGILATIIGTLTAYGIADRRMSWRTFWLALVISPMMVPNIVIGVGIFYLYAPLGLVGSSVGLTFAHAVIALPYVVVTVLAVLQGYDERLNHAAWTLGASVWQTFMRIQLPLIKAGIFAAFLFAFIKSFDDLTIALFVTAGLSSTLPKEMWDAATTEVNPELAAVSTITLLIVLVVIYLAERLQTRSFRLKG